MTVERIVADCDEHDIHITIARVPNMMPRAQWSCRIGSDLRNMRLAETFNAAILAAWAAYTGQEGAK